MPVVACEHTGMWLDIGRPDDYEEAQRLVAEHPERFLVKAPATRAHKRATDNVTQPYRIQMSDSYERS
jgi:NDP-sugar pyrophosphorylase family protein